MKHVPWLIALVVGCAGSFLWGTRVGVDTHAYADAQYQAALLTYEIGYLQQGKIDQLKELKEIDLNAKLAYYYIYEHGISRWLWPELASPDRKQIIFAATYRKNNPYHDPSLSSACPPTCTDAEVQFAHELAEWQVTSTQHRDAVVERYAQ